MTKGKRKNKLSTLEIILVTQTIFFPLVLTLNNWIHTPLLDPRPAVCNSVVQSPVINSTITPTPTPVPIKKVDKEKFFDTIWSHETTRGKNNNPVALHMYCRNLGKWNEIGYNPQKKHCFDSKDQAIEFVNSYINRNCSQRSQNECLCRWNTGKFTSSCAYAQGNLAEAN